jgi:cobalt/nickel transport system permease protein
MPHRVVNAGQQTLLHRAPPASKLATALVLVAGTALLPRRFDALYLAPMAALVLGWIIGRMPFTYLLPRLLVAEPIILGIAVMSLLTPSARPLFVSAVAKSNLCVLTMLLLTWTTPFPEILQVLRRVRVPGVMLTTLALMVRYLPVLAEESQRMQRARASRTFSRRRRLRWATLAAILGQLFIRTTDRAERIYLAMCARGWR